MIAQDASRGAGSFRAMHRCCGRLRSVTPHQLFFNSDDDSLSLGSPLARYASVAEVAGWSGAETTVHRMKEEMFP